MAHDVNHSNAYNDDGTWNYDVLHQHDDGSWHYNDACPLHFPRNDDDPVDHVTAGQLNELHALNHININERTEHDVAGDDHINHLVTSRAHYERGDNLHKLDVAIDQYATYYGKSDDELDNLVRAVYDAAGHILNKPGVIDLVAAVDVNVRGDDLYQLSRWLDDDSRTDPLYVAAKRLIDNAPVDTTGYTATRDRER